MPSPLAGLVLASLLAQAPPLADPAVAAADARAAAGDLAGAATDFRALLALPTSSRALVLSRLAEVERRLGDDEQASRHAQEAADLYRRNGDPARAARALYTAATSAFATARHDDAARLLDEAARLSAQAGDWAQQTVQLNDLGSVHFVIGRYDDAARVNAQALSLTEQHRDIEAVARLRPLVLANQAALEQRLGRYATALATYQAMVASGPPLPPAQQAQVLVNQGALFRRLGDPYKALDAYAAARAHFAAARDAAGEASVLTNRGIALALDLGRPGEAAVSFGEALAVANTAGVRREALLAQLYRGEALLRAGRPAEAGPDFETARALASSLETREEEWKAMFGLGRVAAGLGDATGARAAFDRAITIIDALRERLAVPTSRAEFFQDKREVYDARIAAGLGVDAPATSFALIEQSRARAWRDRMALGAVSLEAVQATLPPGTMLLAYWMSADRAAVVRVTREEARVVPLTVDRALVGALDTALRRPGSAWTSAAEALGRALVPAGLVQGAAHLIVVPDGALGAVPFDTLMVEGAPLADRVAVSVLPTAALRQLAPPATDRGWRAPWARQLAAFGDPLSGADTWQTAGGAARLAGSAAEVRAVAAALGGAHQVFLGAGNRKRALVEALATPPPVLHLATHAVADLASGEQSRLLFSPATADGPVESLFLREVYALPLTGVDLAVLSACETERGPDVRGEGVQGFSRGLLAAGARRAITTLWRVPDAPTALLMQRFYQGVQAGLPLDEALAQAKRALRDNAAFAHPHYWAAFVLTGPADALPRTLRWRDVAGVALVALGTLAALRAWRTRRRAMAAR